MSRWGSTGIFDSSLLTSNKQTRAVFSNVLAQRTAVDKKGLPFMVIQGGSVGQGGPVNTYSIAAETGAITLTRAEFDAVVASETPGPSGMPPITFSSDGTTLNISTIPAGYTSLQYKLCGGGGAGGGKQSDAGGGGGSGGYLSSTVSVYSGQSISIILGTGGPATQDATDISGEDTILTVNGVTFTAGGGGGGSSNGSGGNAGSPAGTAGSNRTTSGGGYAGGNGGTGGGGGGGGGAGDNGDGQGGAGANGASAGTNAVTDFSGGGGDGYYQLILT